MIQQPNVTIIIPTFNLEKYIASTLESVVLQKDISMEVLVVDDNSSDSTREIVKKYTVKYPFIKLLINERTKGVSGARNTAIAHMKGENCLFLDGDDLLLPNSLHLLLSFMKQQKTPIVRGLLSLFCHQRWIYFKSNTNTSESKSEYPKGTFAQCLYQSSFIKENNILFPENLSAGEDRVFFCHAFCLVDDIPSINEHVYAYRINHKKSQPTAKQSFSFMKHFILVRSLLEKFDKMVFYPSYLQSQFISEWLHITFYILQESPKAINSYLEDCANTLNGMRNIIEPSLKRKLNDESDAFFQAIDENDYDSMLEILKKTNSLSPYGTYIGIKDSQLQSRCMLIRILYRLKNTFIDFSNFKCLCYVLYLKTKAKIFSITSK